MSIAELVAAVAQAGGRLAWDDGKPRLVGAFSDDLIREIRANRDAFLEAWDAYEDELRRGRGWGVVPTGEIPLRQKPPEWRPVDYRRVERWVRRQPDDVVKWAWARSQLYREAFPRWADNSTLAAAFLDLWEWQMGAGRGDPAVVVRGLEEADNG